MQGSALNHRSVIFHGKKKYWAPGADYHYHQGMAAGDNTLEPLLMRRIMSVFTANGGAFDPDAMRDDYIKFMTTTGTHNDTYCGTCHRMFFANLKSGMDPSECPDNDGHNVDNTDSLVAVVPLALAAASQATAQDQVAAAVRVTRRSPPSEQYARLFTGMLRDVVVKGRDVRPVCAEVAKQLGGLRLSTTGRDPVTA